MYGLVAEGWAFRRQTAAIELLARLGAPIDPRSYEGVTPLHVAAFFNHLPAVRTLLAHGANILATDNDLCTPSDYVRAPARPRVVPRDFLFLVVNLLGHA